MRLEFCYNPAWQNITITKPDYILLFNSSFEEEIRPSDNWELVTQRCMKQIDGFDNYDRVYGINDHSSGAYVEIFKRKEYN
jgi:hypothetical protein